MNTGQTLETDGGYVHIPLHTAAVIYIVVVTLTLAYIPTVPEEVSLLSVASDVETQIVKERRLR